MSTNDSPDDPERRRFLQAAGAGMAFPLSHSGGDDGWFSDWFTTSSEADHPAVRVLDAGTGYDAEEIELGDNLSASETSGGVRLDAATGSSSGGSVNGTLFLAEYADDPDAAGTEADPYLNAVENLLAAESLPLAVETGPYYYKEQNAPHTVTGSGFHLMSRRGGKPHNSSDILGVIATSGTGLLSFDGGNFITLEDVAIFNEAMDQTGTALAFIDGGNIVRHGTILRGFSTNVLYDGAVGVWVDDEHNENAQYGIRTEATSRNPTTIYHNGGNIKGMKGAGSASIQHNAGWLSVHGAAMEANDRRAVVMDGGQCLWLEENWYEQNDRDGAGVPTIDIQSVANSNRGVTIRDPYFNDSQADPLVRLADAITMVLENSNKVTGTLVSTTSAATGSVTIHGDVAGSDLSMDAATDYQIIGPNPRLGLPGEDPADVSGSRSLNTWYTNSTGFPLIVDTEVRNDGGPINAALHVSSSQTKNNKDRYTNTNSPTNHRVTLSGIVPPGFDYQVEDFNGGASVGAWHEAALGRT